MSKVRKDDSFEFTDKLFPEVHHICMIYDNEEQRRKIVAKFLAAGLKRGELLRYIADVATPEEIRSWLLEMGVELPEDESFSILLRARINENEMAEIKGNGEKEKEARVGLLRKEKVK